MDQSAKHSEGMNGSPGGESSKRGKFRSAWAAAMRAARPRWIRAVPRNKKATEHREEVRSLRAFRGRGTALTWLGRCTCGWKSNGAHDDENQCHEEYRTHVVESLGRKAHYVASVLCLNCLYRGKAKIVIGQEARHGICPNCNIGGKLQPEEEPVSSETEEIDAEACP